MSVDKICFCGIHAGMMSSDGESSEKLRTFVRLRRRKKCLIAAVTHGKSLEALRLMQNADKYQTARIKITHRRKDHKPAEVGFPARPSIFIGSPGAFPHML